MTTDSVAEGPSDADLIIAVRGGDSDAYATLYARHRAAAYNLATQLARSAAEADDLVSEAFAKLLDVLRGGGGPDWAFRAYLLTALRHWAYDRIRQERKVELTDDETAYDASVPFTDTAVAGLERSFAARAFRALPERWQAVLWHTEVEGQSPVELAPLLGLSANGVSALSYRAREGLRQAYLQIHLTDPAARGAGDKCRLAVERLGAWTRQGLSKRETAQVEQHLDQCESCRELADELADVNGGLRAFVAPLVLGSATAGYLAAGNSGTATALGLTAVGVGTGASSGAGMAGSAAGMSMKHLVTIAGSTVAVATAVVVGVITAPAPTLPDAAPGATTQVPVTRETVAPGSAGSPGPPGSSVPSASPEAGPSTGPEVSTPVGTPEQPTSGTPVDPQGGLVDAKLPGHTPGKGKLHLTGDNLGPTTERMTVTMALPAGVAPSPSKGDCVETPGGFRCTAMLRPGQKEQWQVWLTSRYDVDADATITAELGTASETMVMRVQIRGACSSDKPKDRKCL